MNVKMLPTRDGYGHGLLELGASNPDVLVLDADLAKSTRSDWFAAKYPDRFFDIGIAEQDMIGTAAGLSLGGKIPFATTYGVFVAGRAWDQIRTTVCYSGLNVKIAGAHGGISVAVGWTGGGGFRFYRLGPAITDEAGRINSAIRFSTLAAHVWFSVTYAPLAKMRKSPLLGVHKGTAIYLLYNGILGDKKSNTLTSRTLRDLPSHDGPKIIFSECCGLDDDRLRRENITFKHIPYDIKGR